MSIEKAREIILDRVSPEIFLAKQSASIWQNIGEYSSVLNGTTHQQVFGLIQIQALSTLVLSLGKLFERPDARYPNFSIPSAIEYLKEDIENVRVNNASVPKLIDDLTDSVEDQSYLLQNSDELPQLLLKEFDDDCPRSPARSGAVLDESFERIKVIRDKRVAHSEDADLTIFPDADWDAVESLIAFGESFVNLAGYGFFGFSRKGRVVPKDLNLINQPSGSNLRAILKTLTSNLTLHRTLNSGRL